MSLNINFIIEQTKLSPEEIKFLHLPEHYTTIFFVNVVLDGDLTTNDHENLTVQVIHREILKKELFSVTDEIYKNYLTYRPGPEIYSPDILSRNNNEPLIIAYNEEGLKIFSDELIIEQIKKTAKKYKDESIIESSFKLLIGTFATLRYLSENDVTHLLFMCR